MSSGLNYLLFVFTVMSQVILLTDGFGGFLQLHSTSCRFRLLFYLDLQPISRRFLKKRSRIILEHFAEGRSDYKESVRTDPVVPLR